MMRTVLLLMIFFVSSAVAKGVVSPEALGAKALLEDLLSRRYSQELATRIDRQSFTLGAELDLKEIKETKDVKQAAEKSEESISDLMLGNLDPEELIKRMPATSDEKQTIQGFLKNFRIHAVTVSVGLHEELPAETKAEVEKWLSNRLQEEFGKSGKGKVNYIRTETQKKPSLTPLDLLEKFQQLAGQLVLGLALLLGLLLWIFLGSKSKQNGVRIEADVSNKMNHQGHIDGQKAAESVEVHAAKQKEREELQEATTEIATWTERLIGLLPRISNDFEKLIITWCQMGEIGKFRLVCFAEAVGKEIGKMPVPADAINDISKIFWRMPEVSIKEKRDALQKAYWDILTAINVGTEALVQPFGYMANLRTGMVNKVLMSQNPKMKAIVSVFLPQDVRAQYFRSLSSDEKRELLTYAGELSDIETVELKSMESSLKRTIEPPDSKEKISLQFGLEKLIAALTPTEEISILGGLSGMAIALYKQSQPSLAFLPDWPDDKLKLLLGRTTADELTAYLRFFPDQQKRFLTLATPLLAEMVDEELKLTDKTSSQDKAQWLSMFKKRVEEMVQLREIQLAEVFAIGQDQSHGRSESGSRSAA